MTAPGNSPAVEPVNRFRWEQALRRADIKPAVQHVLFVLASYADADGTNARPGEARLATDTNRSVTVVRRALAAARQAGWIARSPASTAQARGYGRADEYALTVPANQPAPVAPRRPAAPAAKPRQATGPGRADRDSSTTTGRQRPMDNRPPPGTHTPPTGRPRPEPPGAHAPSPIHRPTQRPITRARAAEHAAVVDILRRMTGKTINHNHAELVVRQVLDTHTVRNRLAYLRAALERDPDRFLPTPTPPPFTREQVAA